MQNAIPFSAIKGDEAARARAKEAAESQNKEWYKEANACIDAGEYEDAIKLLEKLPTDYEDSRYIIPYAEYCIGVADKEKIALLFPLSLSAFSPNIFQYIHFLAGNST